MIMAGRAKPRLSPSSSQEGEKGERRDASLLKKDPNLVKTTAAHLAANSDGKEPREKFQVARG